MWETLAIGVALAIAVQYLVRYLKREAAGECGGCSACGTPEEGEGPAARKDVEP
jgi:hypothetical protein